MTRALVSNTHLETRGHAHVVHTHEAAARERNIGLLRGDHGGRGHSETITNKALGSE